MKKVYLVTVTDVVANACEETPEGVAKLVRELVDGDMDIDYDEVEQICEGMRPGDHSRWVDGNEQGDKWEVTVCCTEMKEERFRNFPEGMTFGDETI